MYQSYRRSFYSIWYSLGNRKRLPRKDIYVEMDTRFTMVYRITDDVIKLIHVHHSIPNFDQMKDEYYPKTITEKHKKH